MKIGIGLGLDSDPAVSARSAARQALKNISKPDLALAFGSISLDQKKVHQALCREIPSQVILGGSSYAEITPVGVTRKSVAVMVIDFEGPKVSFADAQIGNDPHQGGLALAKKLNQRRQLNNRDVNPVGLFLSTVTSGYENKMLDTFWENSDRIPVFGGMPSGDYDKGTGHPRFWMNYQYIGSRLRRHSARLAVIDLPRKSWNAAFGFSHGWRAVGPEVELTRCQRHQVYEINDRPVFDYYRQFIGEDHPEKFFELMIQRYGFALRLDKDPSRTLLKLPVDCDYKKGFISYYPAEDLQGRRVNLIQASRSSLIQGAREASEQCHRALDGQAPSFIFMVSCCTRGAILHSQQNRELQVVRDVFGPDVPIFGYYSGGEIFPFLSRYQDAADSSNPLAGSRYHTTTVGLMALTAPAPVRVYQPSPLSVSKRSKAALDAQDLRQMLEQSEQNLDSTESFLNNLSRKSYQDADRLRQQNDVIHRYTPHQVWEKVGASVARGDYELPDAEFRGCFLFMDVKGFTAFSETSEPAIVVSMLNQIFGPATEIIYRYGGDVDKYIGDCIFAVFEDSLKAVQATKDILLLVRSLEIKGNPFSVRFGLNSGRAIRANVGSSGRREYTFIGDAVNIAQRLESHCTPGRVLLSEELLGTAKSLFTLIERREIQAKGKSQVIVAYECGLENSAPV